MRGDEPLAVGIAGPRQQIGRRGHGHGGRFAGTGGEDRADGVAIGAEGLGGRELELEKTGDEGGGTGVGLRRVERAVSFRSAPLWVGASVEEELDDRQAAGEGGGVEGRAAVAAEGVCVGAGVEERPGRVDVADEGCERDQWHPELGVDPGGVGAGRERRSNTGGIPGPDRRGQ